MIGPLSQRGGPAFRPAHRRVGFGNDREAIRAAAQVVNSSRLERPRTYAFDFSISETQKGYLGNA